MPLTFQYIVQDLSVKKGRLIFVHHHVIGNSRVFMTRRGGVLHRYNVRHVVFYLMNFYDFPK